MSDVRLPGPGTVRGLDDHTRLGTALHADIRGGTGSSVRPIAIV